MAADDLVVEPGDVLLLHTGYATKILEWDGQADVRQLFGSCAYLDAHDESLLEWIADSQISALVADNYAVEGLLGKDRDPSRHSFLPIHNLCLFKLGVPLEIGRASCRERVCQYRVDLGGRRIIKKKKDTRQKDKTIK